MKHNAIIRQLLFPALCLLGLLATSCIHEDLEECYTLRLRAENIKGEDVTGLGYVSAASLYIFDENLNYLETRVLEKDFIISHDEIVLDNYPASQKLNIVAWGNVNVLGDKQEVTESKRIEELKVMLKSQNSQAVLPDSLYYGTQQVQTKAGGITENKEIVVHPKVGSVTIETRNLEYGLRSKGISSVKECDFYLNRTLSGFDYQGEQIGDSVYYNPASVPNDEKIGEWKTPNLQTACPGDSLGVSLDINGINLGSATHDQDNKPIATKAGENTHIVLEFAEDGTLSARVQVRPWGEVNDHIEF
ncbi:FimB/Mfa2 family fimbrial subunit [Parabacteroides goldsteinii]|uniref:FimB/Mfa2 family fimbrial subunit n=1 Tax=Parabacteroides goldsteinii TaxID=328812 RepID=UPI002420136C|nr:FimB/Mfa2 family fimbrial subunit [Parabacteroides goldsteinii]